MTFEIIKGDLIELAISGQAKIIVHGCNCFHAMGAGIAGSLAKRFPEIPMVDQFESHKGDHRKLTSYTSVTVTRELREVPYQERATNVPTYKSKELDNPFTCINLYTQYVPGADFLSSLFPEALKRLNHEFKGETLWFPRIGAGIAKGNWMEIEDMLLKYLPDVNVKVVVL